MPPVFLIFCAIVAALGASAVGWFYLQYLRNIPGEPAGPDETSDRPTAYRHAIRLAIEMCRADGMLSEQEIGVVETFFARECADLGPEFAEVEVHKALRSTIRRDATASSVQWLAEHAASDDKQKILGFLAEVARADGDLSEHERTFFRFVGKKWSHSSAAVDAMLTKP